MRIKATDEQVLEMCAKASNAASPMGMGFLQFNAATRFRPGDFQIEDRNGRRSVYLDYVEGRMVKLNMRETQPGVWEASDRISPDYESWIAEYPSYAALAKAAGAEVL